MNKITIVINKDFGEFKKGSKIKVDANKGIPLDKFWRDRLKDSEIDNCVSIHTPPKTSKTKHSNQEKD